MFLYSIEPKKIISYKVNNFKYDKTTTNLTLDCDIVFKGELSLTSYLNIDNVTFKIDKMIINLFTLDFPYFLSPDSEEFFLDMFSENGRKFDSLYWVDEDDFFQEFDEYDIDFDRIEDGIKNALSTFNPYLNYDYHNKIMIMNDTSYKCYLEFVNENTKEFLKKFWNGELVFYKVYKDDEELGDFESFEDAKEFVRETIKNNENITKKNSYILRKYTIERWTYCMNDEEKPNDIDSYGIKVVSNAYYDDDLKKELGLI